MYPAENDKTKIEACLESSRLEQLGRPRRLNTAGALVEIAQEDVVRELAISSFTSLGRDRFDSERCVLATMAT